MFLGLSLGVNLAQDNSAASARKVILLISEQNIAGPQHAWWASEIDLSTVEAKIAQRLIENGFQVLEPSDLSEVIQRNRAFRMIRIQEGASRKLGKAAKADYVILGKAIASAGGNVPQSNLRSCFANITGRVIRVKDGRLLTYLDASGNSAHMDVVSGGREALANASEGLAVKIIEALNKDGGK